ncbi:MAG: DUF2007 domain-containing protein [Chloroflexota bacterium]
MSKELIWKEVYKTYGLPEAQIIAGQLRAEGLMARAMPLEAGSRIGLTVGKLGEAVVLVPESQFDEAESIIFEPLPEDWADHIEDDGDL